VSPVVQSEQHDTLGCAVRLLRDSRGISQEELGFRAGLHRNYIGAIERGEINPTFRILLKLATGLAVPLSQIIATYEHPPDALAHYRTRRRPSCASPSPFPND
jgi:transcriptional regulator with XRE-family HTH domain